jgi:hypothetical protein
MTASNESQRMWKETLMPYFRVTSRHFPGGSVKKQQRSSLRMEGVRAYIWTRCFPAKVNIDHEHHESGILFLIISIHSARKFNKINA